MDVIVNPTNKCNFNCSFCAASKLCDKTITSKTTINLLKKFEKNLGQVIINGGDPLVMPVSYYEDLISYLESLDHYVSLSLTTNLWDFYRLPFKWKNVLSNNRVGVITSFQYGTKRKLKSGETFGEQKFRDIIELFNEVIGYKPNFISVIDSDNEFSVIPTVKLAKNLGIKCKINKAIISGRQESYYPRYKIFKHYIDIINLGLREYEMNIELLTKYFTGKGTYCDIDRNCHNNLRVINPDGKLYTCSYTAESESDSFKIDLHNKNVKKFPLMYDRIKNECISCPNYNLCNSCRIYIKEVLDNKDQDNYCYNMKQIIPELKEKCLSC